jgi:hypothetical protein
MSFFMKKIGNPLMMSVLRSSTHSLMSKTTAVLTLTGKKTGKEYSLPVNYQRKENIVLITSLRDRTWWKNLRGGAKVSLLLAGVDYEGDGEVFESPSEVETCLGEYLQLNPSYPRYFGVGVDEEGNFYHEDLAKAAENRVMVRVSLSS